MSNYSVCFIEISNNSLYGCNLDIFMLSPKMPRNAKFDHVESILASLVQNTCATFRKTL